MNYWQKKRIPKQIITFGIILIFAWTILPSVAQAGLYGKKEQSQSIQPYLDQVIARITEFSLDNGLKFLVLEDHSAPVVSFVTYANVGGVDEPVGKTGVAHFLEHLAFKGTSTIGTTNYAEESKLLDRLDQISQEINAAKAQGKEQEAKRLDAEFHQVEAQASQFVKQNEFGQIVETAGGVGLNATTSADATNYFYSFPSNKLELWMSLESERFLDPVFREFYKEKEVILEERRMRTDNSPTGQMVEAFLGKAFTKHPYQRPVIGYPQDLKGLTREDVQNFFKTYYTPSNLTIAIVGDVNATQVQELAKVYFGRFPTQDQPQRSLPVEPPQTETKEVSLTLPSQPIYFEGYHRPSLTDPDNAVYELITAILSDGRTSRLYKSLVEEQQLALQAEGFNGFPGDKYPTLVLFYALTAPNHTLDELAVALDAEITKIKTEPVTEIELERVKTQAKAGLLRILNSNMGMAKLLAEYEVKTGDWRNLFKQIDAIEAVTPQDILRVANSTFTPENRTIGKLISE